MISPVGSAVQSTTRIRALIVEPDDTVRLRLTGLLQRNECDVHACSTCAEAAKFYDRHDLIVAAVGEERGSLQSFVAGVRSGSGESQPFILGLVACSGVQAPENPAALGLNEILPWPHEHSRLQTRLSALVRERRMNYTPATATAPHGGWTTPASQVLLEQLPSAVAVLDTRMRYLAANRRWKKEFQLEDIPLTGQSHFDIFPDLHPAWRDLYDRCLAGHRERSDDDLLVRPDGTQDWVRWDIQPWQNGDGETGGLILACTLIRREGGDPLQTAFERNLAHSLLHSSAAPVVIVDTSGRILKLNEPARALAGGATIHESLTFFWAAMFPQPRREAARARVLELLTMAGPGRRENWPLPAGSELSPRPAARVRNISWSVFPHRSLSGALEGLIFLGFEPAAAQPPTAMTNDASRKGNAAPDTSPGDDAFLQIAEAAPFGMIVLNEEAELVYANPQHRTVLGFSVDECGGIIPWLERACAADDEFKRRALDEWWERVWRRHAAFTCSMRTAGGILKEIEFRPAPLPGHRLLLTVFDITDAMLEEQAIRASEARYRGLFQNCAAGVCILNSSGNITETNPVFDEMAGSNRMDIRRSGLAALLPAETAALVREAAATGTPHQGEVITEIRSRDGSATRVGLGLSVLKNDEGAVAYTACYFHPLHQTAAGTGSSSEAIREDWSRTVPDCLLILDAAGTILDHSDARDFSSALPRAQNLQGRALGEVLPAVNDLLPLDVMVERLRENPAAETRCEFNTALVAGGKSKFIEARMVALPPAAGGTARYGLVLRDLTAVAHRPQTGGMQSWLRNLSQPMLLSNERGRITGLNPAAEDHLGWTSAELEGSGLFRLFRPDDPKGFSAEITGELTRHRRWKATTTCHRKDGTSFEAAVELVPAHDEATGSRGFITIIQPAPEAPANQTPPAPVKPAVTLHRARNDFQVLSSLLTLQAERTADGESRSALLAGKDRLTAVSLIYRLIGGEEDTVDFARYATELGRSLLDSHKVPSSRVKIETAFESVRLPQKTAITLGIILEELITGSLADSFTGETTGTIRISLTTGGGEGVLIIRDNGTLLNEALRAKRTGSFSWQVVQTLSEQISGVLTLLSDLENQVRLRFRLSPPA